MIVELRARRRMRPRRAIIIHTWIVHEHPAPKNWLPDTETVFEANQFVRMKWPTGPDAWTMEHCEVCNREFLWDRERYGKRPPCPHCAEEWDAMFEEGDDE